MVSIPYGSIKSDREGPIHIIIEVSIPYGSIKSGSAEAYASYIKPFQFLMVRLKESRKLEAALRLSFQFLMVRLKDTNLPTMQPFLTLFQFLMVRLKVN